MNSVNLAQLPYTGFDYGPVYNNLFWVVLIVWSFLVGRFLIEFVSLMLSKRTLAKQTMPAIQPTDTPEPKILQEREVRFDPLAEPIYQKHQSPQTPPTLNNQNTIQDPEVVERVKRIVQEELLETRAGMTDDEYSKSDFERRDFDDTNPDVFTTPALPEQPTNKHISTINTQRQDSPVYNKTPQTTQKPTNTNATVEHTPAKSRITQQVKNIADTPIKTTKHVYKDSIELENSGEYPKLVLHRVVAD